MDYDLSTLQSLVDPAQTPVAILNRYIDEFDVPDSLRVVAWIKNQSGTSKSIKVVKSIDYVPATHGIKIVDLADISITIAPGEIEMVSSLIPRPADFLWRFSAYLIQIEDQNSGKKLMMERQMAFCFHDEPEPPIDPDPDNMSKGSIAQWYTLPNTDQTNTVEITPVVVVTGLGASNFEIAPTPGVPVSVSPGGAIVGTGGVSGLTVPVIGGSPEVTKLTYTVSGIVNGDVATLATLPYVKDTVAPTIDSYSMVGSTATLVATDASGALHEATLFISADGGTVWSSRRMVRSAGDFSSQTTFEASLADIPSTGATLTLKAAVRDHPGQYTFSAEITYTP